MPFQLTISPHTFKKWLWNDTENKLMLWTTIVIATLSFTWLKIVYPYPNFIPPDSYSYIEAAHNNDFINTWPIGYSRFIRVISGFTNSHIALVTLQYIMLIASICYFLFSIRYLLSPGKWLFRAIWIISLANPLIPHIANFVSSDCLFATLSLTWFTQILWIIYKPTQKVLYIHSIILLLAFMVRFTAIWYPLISIGCIWLTPLSWKSKIKTTSLMAIFIFAFIGQTTYEYKIKTNTIQYSAFGGWQIAANALYGYAYASKLDSPSIVPRQFRELHTLVNYSLDSIRHLINRPDDNPGIYYLWDLKSPLVLYHIQQWQKDSLTKKGSFEHWASMAPLYYAYGKWLILHHPGAFIKHYLWPNFIRYYSPPAYFMETYNYRIPTVDPIVATWFGWKSTDISTRAKDRTIHIISPFPDILTILNPLFLLTSLVLIGSSSFAKSTQSSKQIIVFMFIIWSTNTLFSTFSAPNELRYQVFPIIITIPFTLVFINQIVQSLRMATPKAIAQSEIVTEL